MPYIKFESTKKGKKVWCTKNLRTGEIVHYESPEKREVGIRLREAARHMRLQRIKFRNQ